MLYKYNASRKMEVSIYHFLQLNYESPSQNPHGHTLMITVHVGGNMRNVNSEIINPNYIKEVVNQLDGNMTNNLLSANPTTEIIANWVANEVQARIDDEWGGGHGNKPHVTKVEVQESEGVIITYFPEVVK